MRDLSGYRLSDAHSDTERTRVDLPLDDVHLVQIPPRAQAQVQLSVSTGCSLFSPANSNAPEPITQEAKHTSSTSDLYLISPVDITSGARPESVPVWVPAAQFQRAPRDRLISSGPRCCRPLK